MRSLVQRVALALAAGIGLLGTRPATANAQKALVYCPVTVDATGCNAIVTALTGPAYPLGVDRGYDGANGTVDLKTVDLFSYSVFVVPSLADDSTSQPYALLRDTQVTEHLKAALIGRLAMWSGSPDQGATNRPMKDALIQNLASWAGGAFATAKGPGLVALLDASPSATARYDWVRAITPVPVTSDPNLLIYSSVRSLDTRATTILTSGSGTIAYTNMATFGFQVPNGAAGVNLDAVGQTGTTQGGQVVLLTMEAGNASGAVVKTDKDDYAPGTTVVISGSGWQANETVKLSLHMDPLRASDTELTATADANGNITNADFAPASYDIGVRFVLTAIGQTSGLRAQTTFTDGSKLGSVAVQIGQSPSPVIPPGSATYTIRVTRGTSPGNGNFNATLSASGFPAGISVTPGSITYNPDNATQDYSITLSVSASVPPGTHAGTLTVLNSTNDLATTPLTLVVGNACIAPTIATHPADLTKTVGDQAAFTVAANGTGPFTYQWRKGVTPVGTSSGFTIPSVVAADAGSYNVVVSNGCGSVTSNSATLTVNKATPTITWNNPGAIQYGTALSGTQLNATASVAGTFVYTPAAGLVLGAGSAQTLSVTFTPTDVANYNTASKTVSINVSQLALTITAQNATKTYGGVVSFGGSEFTTGAGQLVNGDVVNSVTLTSAGAGATATVAGSPYPIVPSAAVGTGLANYAITYSNGSLTVSQKALTITANNVTKAYGDAVTFAGTEFTAGAGQLVNSDAVNSVTLTSGGAAATATVAGSPYAIVPSAALGTGLTNYNIAYANGSLTVSAKALTITASNRTKTYGDLVTFAGTEFTSSGLVNSDAVSTVTLTSAGAAATATVAGSPYTIVASAAVGSGLGNYSIGYVAGSLTVGAKSLTITANSRSKTYGDVVTLDGTEFSTVAGQLVNGDAVNSVTLSSAGGGATATVAGSPYAIVPSAALGTGLGNYMIGYVNGTLTVNLRTLTITASERTKTYGDVVTFAGTEFTTGSGQLVNGDGVTSVTLTSAGADGTAVVAGSPYAIVATAAVGTGLANYSIGYVDGKLTISPKALTITADNKTKTYGDVITFAGSEFTTPVGQLVNGDVVNTVTLTSAGAAATATVGGSPYAIVPSAAVGTGLGNYAIGYTNGSLTVGTKALTITAKNRTKTYGDLVAFAGTEFTTAGLVNSDAVTSVTLASAGAAATAVVAGSPYTIVASAAVGAGLTNYSIGYIAGSLTVDRASLTVTADDKQKNWDGLAYSPFTVTITGFVNGETVSVVGGSAGFTGNAVGAINAGTYMITPTMGTLNAANYQFPPANFVNGTLKIVDTTAPIVTYSLASPNPVPVNTPITVTANVSDATTGSSGISSACFKVDNASCTPMSAISGTSFGQVSVKVTANVTYTAAGVHSVCVYGTDAGNNQGTEVVAGEPYCVLLAVYDPTAGFVTGGGWINSPQGAYTPDLSLTGKATFGFVSKYQKGQTKPTGNTEFQFHAAGMNFKSLDYDWLVISGGNKAQYKGTGTINGTGNYGFLLSAIDGDGLGNKKPDTFRIKIWNIATGAAVYDNQLGADDTADPTTLLGAGSIQIQSK